MQVTQCKSMLAYFCLLSWRNNAMKGSEYGCLLHSAVTSAMATAPKVEWAELPSPRADLSQPVVFIPALPMFSSGLKAGQSCSGPCWVNALHCLSVGVGHGLQLSHGVCGTACRLPRRWLPAPSPAEGAGQAVPWALLLLAGISVQLGQQTVSTQLLSAASVPGPKRTVAPAPAALKEARRRWERPPQGLPEMSLKAPGTSTQFL